MNKYIGISLFDNIKHKNVSEESKMNEELGVLKVTELKNNIIAKQAYWERLWQINPSTRIQVSL